MTPQAGMPIADVITRLATLDLRSWRGLPTDLASPDADGEAAAAASVLGDAFEPAVVMALDTPASAAGARAWARDQRIVLVDVALEPARGAAPLADLLGQPERRLDVTYGLQHLPSGEWIHAARGLALVVDDERVRHVMGFVPCDVDEYERRLRIRFETTRRPLATRLVQEDL